MRGGTHDGIPNVKTDNSFVRTLSARMKIASGEDQALNLGEHFGTDEQRQLQLLM